MARLPRLIDLHVDWMLQYAAESTVFDPAQYEGIEGRYGQAEGYLGATSAAVLSCYRRAADWASQADPWAALETLIVRYEAEFAGRLLLGPADVARWRDDPDGLTWGLIGVEGFDALVRKPADLDRLRGLFDRGVRLFQPAYGADNALGGSSQPGDDRGLTDLGRAFLQTLFDLSDPEPGSPRPIFDLAHLNPTAASDALGWFEADAERPRRVGLIYSHGIVRNPGCDGPRAIAPDNLRRLRALKGYLGLGVSPPFLEAADELAAAVDTAASIPWGGEAGFGGIGIGTDFLGVDRTVPGLGTAGDVIAWAASRYPEPEARMLLRDNAAALLAWSAGVATA